MKNKILKYSVLFSVLILAFGCSSEDPLAVQSQEDVLRGAILRTISINSSTFDLNDGAVEWSVTVEEQDIENGDLLQDVEVYAQLIRANGTNSDEGLVKSIPASEFTVGPFGLPRADIGVSLNEAMAATGVQMGDFVSEDQFNIRFVLNLTNGLSLSNADSNVNVRNGQFFQSPFNYRAQFFCALTDASLFDGSYTVEADAWADYAPGNTVPVEAVSGELKFRILSVNNPFLLNTATSYIEVTIDPSDGTVTAESNEPFDYGSFTADIVGRGSVGTCTGSIDLTIDVIGGGVVNQAFVLVKN